MNTAIILQARTGSSRLPGKMLMPFFQGQGILELLLRRLRNTMPETPLIVATTTSSKDDELVEVVSNLHIPMFRGSEEDVLQRFIDTAQHHKADRIIRVCADNPFLDLTALTHQNKEFQHNGADYLAWRTSNGTPTIKTHYGFWAEAVTLQALKRVATLTDNSFYHEHVTNYIYGNPKHFNIAWLPLAGIEEGDDIRLTIDTAADFSMAQEIYAEVLRTKTTFTAQAIIPMVRNNTLWTQAMRTEILQNKK